uniref:ERBB receptor feedback inhibitor 1a n=1 Tax=Doryrhamphus excisus TaxID=161450 RepID=UPI0025ADCD31|nr:ERBB receptor feedback inhibitor 1a [Doryrhamphus excisus]XP_057911166.1 ERBB receptor feedback inhibitor 1a [Doryrhamphus excisus]
MRPECAWSMSTVGLTAQETYFPVEHPFLRGGSCRHSMDGFKPSWSHRHDLENFYFSLKSAHTDNSAHGQQMGPPTLSYERHKHSSSTLKLPPKKPRPSHLSLSCAAEPSTPSPADDDQVVPSFQRLSMCSSPPQTPGRCSKPLPPIPLRRDMSSEQVMDNEVEFFNSADESCCLVSQQYSKPFRHGAFSRRSFRDCGQVNHAYYDGPLAPQSPKPHQQHQHNHHQQHPAHPPQQEVSQEQPTVCQRALDKSQRKLRRSLSGPAGCFNKPSQLRLACHSRYAHNMDRSEVPPPVPPRTIKTADSRRWSAEVSSGAYSDEDRPPKLPPREPMSLCSSRTPSPKSLPKYHNGILPPTQSFAPDPKFVSRGLQRQNSEGSPCILPIVDNQGHQASHTHYYLLPYRPTFMDSPSVEKLLLNLESPSARDTNVSDSEWDFRTGRKAPVDLV